MKNICLLWGLLMVSGALGAADYLEGKCGDKVPTNGLIGYWPFNGNANDESGKGNHGTLMGTNKPQPTTDRNGNEYSAYLFGGGSPTSLNNSNNHNYIKVANSPSMYLDNEMSVSFWMQQEYFYGHSGAHLIYTDAISDPSVRFSIFCKAGDGNSASPGVFINSGIQSDSSLFITSSNSDKNGGVSYGSTTIKHCYNTKEWVHYVCVVNKDTIKTYINGRLYIQNKIAEHMGSVFQSVNNLSLYIGRMVRDGGVSYWYPYNGKIDDVAFYNRAIMDDEVALLYGDYHDPYARKTYDTTIYATIGCYKTYIWDGRLYNDPGTYNYLYTSKEYGCDSMVHLNLTVAYEEKDSTVNICHGHSLPLPDIPIPKAL